MKNRIFVLFLLPIVSFIYCSENKVKLPVATSLGNLIKIELREEVQTDKKLITSNSDNDLYLLFFEGKNELLYDGKSKEDGPWRTLLDSKGEEFWPVYTGTLTKENIVSNQNWRMNGKAELQGGQLVFKGTQILPEPKLTLVYLVSKNASGLTLKDGDKRYPIE